MEPDNFFARDTETVAEDLIGCVIEKDGIRGRIVEAEAYLEDDPASHAYPRKTERNRLMYETHGKIYVYICYGIHQMLNFTADSEDAGGVLIRAVEPLKDVGKMRENRGVEEKQKLCDGPGKVCEAFGIDKSLSGEKIGETIKLEKERNPEIEVSRRIGISKAEDRTLRFYERGSRFVSDRNG